MATIAELKAKLSDFGDGPQSVSIGGETVTARTAADLIQIIQFMEGQELADSPKPHQGLRFTQLKPPGCG